MTRTVDEWIAKNDNAAIPPRVKERVARKAGDKCFFCGRKVGPKLRAEMDHVISLVLGGEHRESNLRLLCHECHAAKTKIDVALKAKVARVRKKHLGIRKPSRMKSAPFRKSPPQRTASRPLDRRDA